jgi:hypothetical protein
MNILISLQVLKRTLNCSHPTIQAVLDNGWDVPKPRGRHSAMGVECEGGIFNWIEN